MLSRSTTLLFTVALGSLALGGCTVVTTDDQGDAQAGNTTGSATVTTGSTSTGTTGATTGSTVTTGSTATTTTGTSNGSTGSTSTTGTTAGATTGDGDAAACLGDGDPDASSAASDASGDAAPPCNSLSYATSACPAADDGGMLTPPVGKAFCDYMADHARPQVFAALLTCLKGQQLLHTPCSTEHEQSVSDCFGSVFSRACDAPGVTLDGSSYDCAKLTTQCAAEGTDAGTAMGDAGTASDGASTTSDDAATADGAASADAATTADGGATADGSASTLEASSPADSGASTPAGALSEATCKRYTNGLTAAARADLFTCFAAKGAADGTCSDRFNDCLLAY